MTEELEQLQIWQLKTVDGVLVYCLGIPNYRKEQYNSLKEKIRQAIEKAEKYDSLMSANSEVVKNNIFLSELQSQNKSLSEENARLKEQKIERVDGRYGILELNKIISDKRDEIQSLKAQLETITLQRNGLSSMVTDLQKQLEQANEVIDEIKKLIKKVKDNPKENPCNAWVINSLVQIISQYKEKE